MAEPWPVVIPSKARVQSTTAALLRAAEVKAWRLLVEPQDAEAYAAKWGDEHVEVLPEDDQGLTYSRNRVLELAREAGWPWVWQLDDDVTQLYLKGEGTKLVKTDAKTALLRAQRVIGRVPNVGQAGLEYQQFAWRATKPCVLNSYCDVVVAINTENTRTCRYREIPLKEDRDFTLQVLSTGRRTCRVQTVSFGAPQNGSNKGGLQPVYATDGREERSVKRMAKLWPGVVERQVKPNGRVDCKIHWRFFREKVKR